MHKFQFLYILSNACYSLFICDRHPNGCEGISHQSMICLFLIISAVKQGNLTRFNHSFNKCLSDIYSVPGTVLTDRDTTKSEKDKDLVLHGLYTMGEDMIRYRVIFF